MRVRRIVVALDASPGSLAALESAAGLAAGPESEILGLFVEDLDLLRFAALPFASEIQYPSAARRAVDPASMARMLRATAQRAQEALAEVAGRRGIRWSFKTMPGPVDQSLLEALETSDLIALGTAGLSSRVERRAGSTALRVASKARGSVLLLASRRRSGPVAMLYTGPDTSLPTVAAAAALAASRSQALLVLVEADEPGRSRKLEEEARRAIGEQAIETRFRTILRPDSGRLLRVLREEGCVALAFAAADSRLQGDWLAALLHEASLDLLIVR